jgi:hypothetical protein
METEAMLPDRTEGMGQASVSKPYDDSKINNPVTSRPVTHTKGKREMRYFKFCISAH